MNHIGQLIRQDLLGLVQLASFPCVHLIDLLQRQEGQHADTFQHIRVSYISPVLVKIKGRGLLRIQPDRAGLGLAHLLALRIEQQCDGHGAGVLAQLPADQLGSRQHIAPLVVPAELQVTAVFLEQCVEIICLHDHVVKFQEA